MSRNSYRKKFLAIKKYYKGIGAIQCPALNNELIYFKRDGFEHLIRKGRKIRPISDQLRRFKLLKEVKVVIEQGKIIDQRTEHKISFWTLGYRTNNTVIKIIVEQEKTGAKKFLSIMER